MIFSQILRMSQRNKYRRTFLALHGRNERLMARGLVNGIRKDILSLGEMNQYNYESYLKGLEFKELEAEIQASYVRAGQIGSMIYTDLDKVKTKRLNPFFSEFWNNWIVSNSSIFILNKVRTIRETLLAEISGVVLQAIENAQDLRTITTIIKDHVKEPNFYRWQAQRIARTETTTAMNTAMQVAGEQSGLRLNKVWISALDGRTRDAHADLAGTSIPQDDVFRTINGNSLAYPGDPNGAAEEIINCRCSLAYEPVRDGAGNLILD